MNINSIRRAACAFFCLAAVSTVISGIPASASVSTTVGPTGPADAVYVAGCPDAYPVEYYDPDTRSYRGVLPDILEAVSDDTGLDFVYISAGTKNEQKRLSRNNQVELLTAVLLENNDFDLKDGRPVLTVIADNGKRTYGVGFTETAPSELVERIKGSLSKITAEQKNGMLIKYAENNRAPGRSERYVIFTSTVGGTAFVTLAVVFTVLAVRKRKNKRNDMTDPLTGIGDAAYYEYFFDTFVSGQAKNLYSIAYIAVDTEEFEKSWGSGAVDDIQRYAAARLNAAMGAAECAARIRDGVFASAFQADSREATDSRIAEIVNSVNQYLCDFNSDWSKLFSAGVCRMAEHPDCNAETALYNAKQGYVQTRGSALCYAVGSDKQLAGAKMGRKLRASLGKAIENDEFRIYMQFIVDSKTSAICGAEVLSRWQNSEYGLLRPNEYIEILKSTGKIVEHDYSVFSKACAKLESWNSGPLNTLFLSCNFTRASVSRPDFADRVLEIAGKYRFEHSRMIIEMTEDLLDRDSIVTHDSIRRCRETGFRIAIDDMGTGFSSLADLYDNDIDIVKIEQSFTAQCTSPRRITMLRDIVSLVHNTGAAVICEGIESREQQEAMRKTGCDMMQGYYYSRALPAAECERFIISNS